MECLSGEVEAKSIADVPLVYIYMYLYCIPKGIRIALAYVPFRITWLTVLDRGMRVG